MRTPRKAIYSARGGLDETACSLIDAWIGCEGHSVREAARRLNVSQATVRRYLESGAPNHCRLPPLNSHAIRKRRACIKRLMTDGIPRACPSANDIRKELVRFGFSVSKSTVRRDFRALNLSARKRPKVSKLYPDDPARRLKFATTNTDDPKLCIFSDEKMFDCNDHGHLYQWVQEGQTPLGREFERWSPKVHVWGCIGIGIKKLVFLPTGSITSEVYKRYVLSRHVVPMMLTDRRPLIFQQDGAKSHTAHAITNYLKRKRISVMENWPARSPDLNPIENLWAILARDVAHLGPVDDASLRTCVQTAWDSIPQSTIDNFVLSFKRRKLDVIRAKGF